MNKGPAVAACEATIAMIVKIEHLVIWRDILASLYFGVQIRSKIALKLQ